MREGEAHAQGGLRADDAVAAEEVGIRLRSGSQHLCCVLGLVGWWAGGLGSSRPARHRAAAPTWAEPQSNPHSRLRPHPALT